VLDSCGVIQEILGSGVSKAAKQELEWLMRADPMPPDRGLRCLASVLPVRRRALGAR